MKARLSRNSFLAFTIRNQFKRWYYRIFGLPPGDYECKIDGAHSMLRYCHGKALLKGLIDEN